MTSLISFAVALLFAVRSANGLTCYTCNSKDNVACAWGLTSFTFPTETCNSIGILDSLVGAAQCYKITAESKDGRDFIARGCLPPGAAIGCNAIASTIGWISSQSSDDADTLSYLHCDTCNTDRCNSAQRATGVTLVALILAGAAFVL